jgi:hypothetical protein
MTDTPETVGLDPVARLAREVKATAAKLDRAEAGHIIKIFYQWQEHRIALGNQVTSPQRAGKPIEVLGHFYAQISALEKQAGATLGEWAESRPEGAWALAQKGIGPVLAAGLSAHIDIRRAETAGAVWRYAGLDNSLVWLSRKDAQAATDGFPTTPAMVDPASRSYLVDNEDARELIERLADEHSRHAWKLAQVAINDSGNITATSLAAALARRPYNADLKVLCWKIGDSFVKVSGKNAGYYGTVYRDRKEQEVRKNANKDFADQAEKSLATRRIQDRKLKQTYEAGLLPPGRLDLRARRYAVKLFLSHWHEVAFKAEFGKEPPVPYPIAHLGHVHRIDPPPGP